MQASIYVQKKKLYVPTLSPVQDRHATNTHLN